MKYNWKRYWCPREGEFILSSEGFLQDPGENHLFNPDLVTIEEISAIPCLILLGEPGIGKSSTMQVEKEAIDIKIHEKGDKALWIDLRSYGSEDRLLKDLFDNEIFLSWNKGDQRLYIFMDSLDECLLRISNLATLLIDKIKGYPIDRLYLRIASRTADWPIFLEKEFNEIWGEDNVKIYELVPLTKNDVIEAAKVNNLEANGFLKEIDNKNVTPLAIKPLTLRFLLNLYKKNYHLPYNQRDLYLRGCILLCEESNESRIASRLKGDFTAEQRLIVAGRIAAITLFANKYAIWTGADYGNMPKEDVHIRTLIGGMENAMELDFIVESFNINENAIYETLKTGLFSSRGPNRMGWVHKTYTEYLAAWYLLQHKLPLEKMLSLITHPLDPSGKLIPQLHGVSIWLANMVPDLTRDIAEREPYLLLKCDLVDTDNKFKEILVKTLFTLYGEKKLPYPSWQEQPLYRKVNHPRLAEQLSEYIFGNNYNTESKIFALRVARACRLDMLQDAIAKIALDASQDIRLRKEAAHNIVDFGTDELKQKLRPLATGDAGEDPDGELKGLGLEALWPDLMGPNELFCIITPPKEHFSGNYSMFFHEIAPHIQPLDLPLALKWIESQQIKDDLSSFSYLADQIMLKAWNHLNHPSILNGLARAMISRLKGDEEHITRFFGDKSSKEALIKNDTKRRLLLSALVPLFGNISDVHVLIHSNPAMITNKDFGWVIEQVKTSKYIDHQQRWARLANYIFDINKVDQISLILSVYHANPGIRAEFAPRIDPITLNSPKADKIRQRYFEIQELMEKREKKKELLDPPPATRIANLLARCESGDYEAWWQLNLDLTLEPDSKRYGNELEPDLTSLPGWKEATVLTRDRIIQTAFDYISSREPEIGLWLGTNIIHRPAIAGYKAFWLLFNERHHLFSSISHETWVKWAPAIIAYPSHLRDISSKDIRKELISRAYQHSPKSVIDALIILLDKDNAELGLVSIIGDLEDIWDENLDQALLVKARDEKLKPESTGDLLDFLLTHDSHEARKYAESLFLSSYPGEATRQQAIIIGGHLLIHISDSSWTILWPIIENNIEMGKEIILYAARKSYRQGKISEKSHKEDYLAKLFIWLYHNCPPSEYSIPLGGFTDTSKYQIAELRDSIIRHLKERGTTAAVGALAEIAKEFPQEDWFNWMVPEAQQIFLQQSWIPYEASCIRDLILDQNKSSRRDANNIRMTKLEEIIHLLRGIEFNLTMHSLRSGSARQDLSRLKTNVESIKSMIETQGQNLAELGLAQEAVEQNILKELEKKKEVILFAVENLSQSYSDRENFKQIYKEIQALKQSKSRDQLELLADISSLIGFAISLSALG